MKSTETGRWAYGRKNGPPGAEEDVIPTGDIGCGSGGVQQEGLPGGFHCGYHERGGFGHGNIL